MQSLNRFLQSVVNAPRKGDENRQSSVVAETIELIVNGSYGYQRMGRSWHTMKKYLNDEKAHQAMNNKFFKRLSYVNDDLFEIQSVKSKVVHKEPIIIDFLVSQYAKLRMLEL